MLYSLRRHINLSFLLFLFLIYVLSELIIFPVGNFSVNDDWWYFRLVTDPGFTIWPEHSFFGYWLAYKTWFLFFPTTYFSLRLFTWILGFVNILIFNRICARFLRLHPLINFFSCLTLLLHPIYLSVSNSGMTEIIFIFYMLGGVFLYLEFLMYQRMWYLALSALLFALMVLTRQIGLTVVFALAITDFFINRDFFKYSLILFLFCLGIYVGFEYILYYTDYNTNGFPFIVADQYFIHVTERKFFLVILKRWVHYLTIGAFTFFPITSLAFLFKYRTLLRSRSLVIISFLLMIPVGLSVFSGFPVGNYLNAGSVGPLNIPESYVSKEFALMHKKDAWYYVMIFFTLLASFVFLITLCYQLTKIYVRYKRFRVSDILTNFQYIHLFALIFFLLYYGAMTIYGSFFDRYILIPQFFFIFIFLDLLKRHFSKSIVTIILLIYFFCFSVFSIHDYFSIRRKSHFLFEKYLKEDKVLEGFIEDKGNHWLKNPLVRRIDPVHPDEKKLWIQTFESPERSVIEKTEYFSLRNLHSQPLYVTQSNKNEDENGN